MQGHVNLVLMADTRITTPICNMAMFVNSVLLGKKKWDTLPALAAPPANTQMLDRRCARTVPVVHMPLLLTHHNVPTVWQVNIQMFWLQRQTPYVLTVVLIHSLMLDRRRARLVPQHRQIALLVMAST